MTFLLICSGVAYSWFPKREFSGCFATPQCMTLRCFPRKSFDSFCERSSITSLVSTLDDAQKSFTMIQNLVLLASLSLGVDAAALWPRLDNGVANTPPMGFALFTDPDCNFTDIMTAGAAITIIRAHPMRLLFAQMQRHWSILVSTLWDTAMLESTAGGPSLIDYPMAP